MGVKKTGKSKVRNEIFRQMSLTSTLALDVPVRPMDAKRLSSFSLANGLNFFVEPSKKKKKKLKIQLYMNYSFPNP